MNFHILKTKSGKEFKLKLASSMMEQFVKESGMGIADGFRNIHNNPVGYIVPLIWASAQKFEHKFTKQMAYDLYDELTDDDEYTIENWFELAADILGASGFFDKETVASMKEAKK